MLRYVMVRLAVLLRRGAVALEERCAQVERNELGGEAWVPGQADVVWLTVPGAQIDRERAA